MSEMLTGQTQVATGGDKGRGHSALQAFMQATSLRKYPESSAGVRNLHRSPGEHSHLSVRGGADAHAMAQLFALQRVFPARPSCTHPEDPAYHPPLDAFQFQNTASWELQEGLP